MSESDENLIHRFRKTAQPELLETLLSRHLDSVRSMVFQMLLDHNAADDVTQEVFLRVLRGLETFDGRSQFSTWLFRIAMNAVRSHVTKGGRLRVQFQNELPEDSMSVRTEPGGCMLEVELGQCYMHDGNNERALTLLAAAAENCPGLVDNSEVEVLINQLGVKRYTSHPQPC